MVIFHSYVSLPEGIITEHHRVMWNRPRSFSGALGSTKKLNPDFPDPDGTMAEPAAKKVLIQDELPVVPINGKIMGMKSRASSDIWYVMYSWGYTNKKWGDMRYPTLNGDMISVNNTVVNPIINHVQWWIRGLYYAQPHNVIRFCNFSGSWPWRGLHWKIICWFTEFTAEKASASQAGAGFGSKAWSETSSRKKYMLWAPRRAGPTI